MLNNVVMMGRLTKDPELRYTESNSCVGRFAIACDRTTKNGEKKADFFNVSVWNKTAEFVEKYFHKGDPIIVSGRLQNNDYTNKDGVKVRDYQIVANNVDFCGGKKSDGAGDQEKQHAAATDNNGFMNIPDGIDEELPFQ